MGGVVCDVTPSLRADLVYLDLVLGEWFLGSRSPSMSIYYQTVTLSSPLPSRLSIIDYLASSPHS